MGPGEFNLQNAFVGSELNEWLDDDFRFVSNGNNKKLLLSNYVQTDPCQTMTSTSLQVSPAVHNTGSPDFVPVRVRHPRHPARRHNVVFLSLSCFASQHSSKRHFFIMIKLAISLLVAAACCSAHAYNVMIIGGTRFSGAALWKELHDRGHCVTVYNRQSRKTKPKVVAPHRETEDQLTAHVKAANFFGG